MTELSTDPNIGRRFGKYQIIRRIGSGGMAVVYLARIEGEVTHEVAIKVLNSDPSSSRATLARFIKEAQAISKIRSSNVVHLIEPPGHTDDGQVYLVMELLAGKSLSDILAEMRTAGQVFSWDKLAPLMLQVCRALHAAHTQGIVHRDLKPSNCFCTELDHDPWHIKVLDFGIAKVYGSDRDARSDESIETQLTQEGMFVGTPHFAAPEIIDRRPEHAIDGRTDIFSLGVMMYQCLTGTLPYEAFRGDKLAVIFKSARERPESPRTRAPERYIPPEVDALVMRAMDIKAEQRFADMLDLTAAIRATIEPARGRRMTNTSEPAGATLGTGDQPAVSVGAETVQPISAVEAATLSQPARSPVRATTVVASLVLVGLAVLIFFVHKSTLNNASEIASLPYEQETVRFPVNTPQVNKAALAEPAPIETLGPPFVTPVESSDDAPPPSTPEVDENPALLVAPGDVSKLSSFKTVTRMAKKSLQTSTGSKHRDRVPPTGTAVCGNSKCENAENSLSCCQDCSCANGMTCNPSQDKKFRCVARLK